MVIYNNAPALKGFRSKYNLRNLIALIRRKLGAEGNSRHKDDEAKWDVVPTKIEMNEVLSLDLTPQDKQDPMGKEDK